MTRLCTKTYDHKIVQLDLINSGDAADGRIVFLIDDNNQHITYYLCQKCQEEWRFYPIDFKQQRVIPQYLIYDFETQQLRQSLKPASAQPKFLPGYKNACLTEEENKTFQAFQPIMQKINDMRAELLKAYENNVQPQTFDALIEQHYQEYAIKLLAKCVQTYNLDEIKKTLSTHWEHIKNNLLCYTTLSNDPRYHELISLFCELAITLANRINQTKKADEPDVCAIGLLMPSLTLESQYPKNFPNLNDAKLNASAETLMRVLQTHIIGNQGQCLVPVTLLSNPDNLFITKEDQALVGGVYPSPGIQSANLQKCINPYFDNNSDVMAKQTSHLDEDTLSRLQHFSPHHEALFQIQAEYQSLLDKDQAILLAQLHRLIKALHQFSAHRGIGKNDEMAMGGGLATMEFFNYYNQLTEWNPATNQAENKATLQQIPKVIRDELEKLRDPKNLASCTGRLAETLEKLVTENTSELAKISIDQDQQAELLKKLLEEKRHSFENNQHTIKDRAAVFISAQHQAPLPIQNLSGKDRLWLTNDMLDLLKIKDHYHIRSMQDLCNLMQSTPEEIALLSQLPGISAEIINVLHGQDRQSALENLVTLITHCSDQKVIAFFKANWDAITADVIINNKKLTTLLDMMRKSMQDDFIALIVLHAHDFIKTDNVLITILNCDKLDKEHRTQILNAVKNTLDKIIRYDYELSRLLECNNLNDDQRTQIWNAVSSKLGAMIKSSYDPLLLLNRDKLNDDQRTQIWNAVKDNLDKIIQHGIGLSKLLERDKLNDDQRTQIWNTVKDNLDKIIQRGFELSNLLECDKLNDDQRAQIWNAVKDNLDKIIQYGHELPRLLECNNLNDDQRTQIWNAVKDNLDKIIRHDYVLSRLLECNNLNDNQRTQTWNAVSGNLDKIIQNNAQLSRLLNCEKLEKEHRTQILDAVSGKLGVMIKSSYDLSQLLNCDKLDKEHRTEILDAVSGNLGAMIESSYNLLDLLNCDKLDKEHRTEILNAIEPNKLKDMFVDITTRFMNKLLTLNMDGLSSLLLALTDAHDNKILSELTKHGVNKKELQNTSEKYRELAEGKITAAEKSMDKQQSLLYLEEALSYLKCDYLIQTVTEEENSHVRFFAGYSTSVKLEALNEILRDIELRESGAAQPAAAGAPPPNPNNEAKQEGLLGKIYGKLTELHGAKASPLKEFSRSS